jgi:hypothetical protein
VWSAEFIRLGNPGIGELMLIRRYKAIDEICCECRGAVSIASGI